MTIEDAAQAAAEKEIVQRIHGAPVNPRSLLQWERDLYVRAFRQGAHWQQEHDEQMRRELETAIITRVEPLNTSPSPSTGSTAADHEVK